MKSLLAILMLLAVTLTGYSQSRLPRSAYNPVKVIDGVTIRDYNNDGWDDIWLLLHEWPTGGGKRSNIVNEPNADYDGDGVTNVKEMLAGTDPWPVPERKPLTEEQRQKNLAAAKVREAEAKQKEEQDGAAAELGRRMMELASAESQERQHREILDIVEKRSVKEDQDAEKAVKKASDDKSIKHRDRIRASFTEEELDRLRSSPIGPLIPKEDGNGNIQLESSFNIAAARSITVASLWPTAVVPAGVTASPLPDLTGLIPSGRRVGIWESGGGVFFNHTEFMTGGQRIFPQDNPLLSGGSLIASHATSVAGCMAAAGINPLLRGMAYQTTLNSWDSVGDLDEMRNAAVANMSLSNHSYGFVAGWEFLGSTSTPSWRWRGNAAAGEDSYFGLYTADARRLDALCNDYPNYLPVYAAGNQLQSTQQGPVNTATGLIPAGTLYWRTHDDDGDGTFVNQLCSTTPPSPANPNVTLVANHAPNAGNPLAGAVALTPANTAGISSNLPPYGLGFDSLSGAQVAKNALIVGAVEDLENGVTDPTLVRSAYFSSRGPTDEGRIKPDVVADGTTFTTTDSFGNIAEDLFDNPSFELPALANGATSTNLNGWQQTAGSANPALIQRQDVIGAGVVGSNELNHIVIRTNGHQVWQDYDEGVLWLPFHQYRVSVLIGRRAFDAATGTGSSPSNVSRVMLQIGAASVTFNINAAAAGQGVPAPVAPNTISWRLYNFEINATEQFLPGNIRMILMNAGPGHSYFDRPQLLRAGSAVSNSAVTSGTSFAAPTVSGGLALLEQQSETLGLGLQRAATRRGLVIQTARDGTRAPIPLGLGNVDFVGPDPFYGYGVPDFTAAAGLQQRNAESPGRRGHIYQGVLFANNIIDKLAQVPTGATRLQATLVYNDPAWQNTDAATRLGIGVPVARGPNAAAADPADARLVNDLDLEIVAPNGTITQAWRLDRLNPATPATRGDNDVDTVKQVTINNPVAGTYRIRVRQDGTLRQSVRLLPGDVGYGTPETDNPQTTENEATAPRYQLVAAQSVPFSLLVDGNTPVQGDDFRMTNLTRTATEHVLQWQSIQGVVYTVERSDNLQTWETRTATGTWVNLTGMQNPPALLTITAPGPLSTITIPVDALPARYYRMREAGQP